ncbi:MAG: (d)CMP kinase [Candidatus Babeliales bacterium]|nr:(d)CMP kinase [Candidatus Babeliales bacterium]
MIITIDGPVASGKSFLARELANKLGFYYLNSGLLYRGLAFVILNNPSLDIKTIISHLKYFYDGHKESIKYDDKDITPFLKTPQIDQASSIMSADPHVREILLDFQRNFAKQNDLVTDGRDCGSVVFENADVKIFLTASIKVRAKRWQHDQELKGNIYSQEECEAIITDRDKRDQEREIAPLVVPKDAIILDNSELDEEETFSKAREIIKNIIS